MKNMHYVFAAVVAMNGCATEEVNSTSAKFKSTVDELVSKKSAVVSDGATDLSKTMLANILTPASASTNVPEWPKIAIRDLDIPANQLGGERPLAGNECIHFNATVWTSATVSDRIDNIRFCAKDFTSKNNQFVLEWKIYSIPGKTTGQLRSDGPVPPSSKLPTDPLVDQWFQSKNAYYYLGSLLVAMGLDKNFYPDKRRIWVVNLRRV